MFSEKELKYLFLQSFSEKKEHNENNRMMKEIRYRTQVFPTLEKTKYINTCFNWES